MILLATITFYRSLHTPSPSKGTSRILQEIAKRQISPNASELRLLLSVCTLHDQHDKSVRVIELMVEQSISPTEEQVNIVLSGLAGTVSNRNAESLTQALVNLASLSPLNSEVTRAVTSSVSTEQLDQFIQHFVGRKQFGTASKLAKAAQTLQISPGSGSLEALLCAYCEQGKQRDPLLLLQEMDLHQLPVSSRSIQALVSSLNRAVLTTHAKG